eukprot:CAMPEP_0170544346 /NCGR_PEP_ID=MMETSP0211-20121228/3145_1 /TAXON_ID=311385 /ORGANISM="Pseudokeronopsis sp., Strain OXSARD2" /LENGTH=99 /DNA_ID=CAMNT_0010847973 /DNA_START=789 /DNA_END=1085 /DNA_ORIENTATION=+
MDYRNEGYMSSTYDVIPIIPLMILRYCILSPNKLVMKMLPPLEPTDYLFEKHKDKGSEKWEIYAWAAREIMAKAGNFKISDHGLKEKFCYEGLLRKEQK